MPAIKTTIGMSNASGKARIYHLFLPRLWHGCGAETSPMVVGSPAQKYLRLFVCRTTGHVLNEIASV